MSTPARTLDEIRSSGVREVRVAFADYNGLLRARSVAIDHLPHVLHGGINFSSPTVDFNSQDSFPPTASFDLTSPDFWAVPDLATYRPAPTTPGVGEMLADLIDARGEPWPGCPRAALRAVVRRAYTAGLAFNVGFEPEGYLFRPADGELRFLDTPKFATLDGLELEPAFMAELTAYLGAAGITVEQWSEEYGPGQVEVNLRYAAPLAAADALTAFKQAFRSLARRHGLTGTFMPKPFAEVAGSGLHVHLSAADPGDPAVNLFDDPADPTLGLSALGRHALGGLLHHGRALIALGASTVNSYKRFLPGSWAPTHLMYSYASRAAFIRIPERETARRLELRSGDPAGNAYLYLTAILAAALDGVERELEPGPPTSGDPTRVGAGEPARVPRHLAEALDALEADDVVRTALGPLITDEYLKIKRSEWDAFVSHVGPWDRDWYLGRY